MDCSSSEQRFKKFYICQYCTYPVNFRTDKVICPTCSERTIELLDPNGWKRIFNNLFSNPATNLVSAIDPVPGAVSDLGTSHEVVCPKCMFYVLGFPHNHYQHMHHTNNRVVDVNIDVSGLEASSEFEMMIDYYQPGRSRTTVSSIEVNFWQDDDVSSVIIGFGSRQFRPSILRERSFMTKLQLSHIPVVTFSNVLFDMGENCPICLEDFAIGIDVFQLFCDHLFHKKCLKLWLKKNTECPLCRLNQSPIANHFINYSRNPHLVLVNKFIKHFDGPKNVERREIRVPLNRLIRMDQPPSDYDISLICQRFSFEATSIDENYSSNGVTTDGESSDEDTSDEETSDEENSDEETTDEESTDDTY